METIKRSIKRDILLDLKDSCFKSKDTLIIEKIELNKK